MFASRNHLLDFADTRLDRGFSVPNFGRLENIDPLEQIAHAESADLRLLRLVVCAALATLLMALASSLT
jgi:hypothetical protein